MNFRIALALTCLAATPSVAETELLQCSFDETCPIGEPCAATEAFDYNVRIDGITGSLLSESGGTRHLNTWLTNDRDQFAMFQPGFHGFDAIDVDADLNAVLFRSEGVLKDVRIYRGTCTRTPE